LFPVINVDWIMAKVYCESWRGARLPLDAEWERVANVSFHSMDNILSTEEGTVYRWGDLIGDLHANYNQNIGDTTPVGSYEYGSNTFGIYDLAGNVWEWVEDVVQPDYKLKRWIRGGSWFNDGEVIRSISRVEAPLDYSSLLIGFRCARSVP
jgi:formylglycine-generating enzyme required for sulfatase activity